MIGGELGQKLVGDAGRSVEAGLGLDPLADPERNVPRERDALQVFRHLEIGLVERQEHAEAVHRFLHCWQSSNPTPFQEVPAGALVTEVLGQPSYGPPRLRSAFSLNDEWDDLSSKPRRSLLREMSFVEIVRRFVLSCEDADSLGTG